MARLNVSNLNNRLLKTHFDTKIAKKKSSQKQLNSTLNFTSKSYLLTSKNR